MSEEPKKEGEAAPAAGGNKKKIIIIAAAAVVVLGGGAGAFLMKGGEKKEEQPAEVAEEVKTYRVAQIPPLIVNLSDASSFLKVSMLIEYDPEIIAKYSGGARGGGGHGGGGAGGGGEGGGGGAKPGELPPLLKSREPMIRDAIIKVLSAKRAEQVLSVEGKDQLKEELIEAINEASGIEEPAVVNVYFTDFIIQ